MKLLMRILLQWLDRDDVHPELETDVLLKFILGGTLFCWAQILVGDVITGSVTEQAYEHGEALKP